MYMTKTAQNAELKTWTQLNSERNGFRKWRGVSDEVSSQIQCLCALFIKEKLKRDGSLSRKVPIITDVLPNSTIRHVLLIITHMSLELERLQPKCFHNISVPVTEASPVMVESIGRSLFKHNDVTWGKIISFMTICSAIAVESARAGQPMDVIQSVVDSTFSVMADEAGPWIEKQGGWNALTDHIRPLGSDHISFLSWLMMMTGFLLTIHWTWALLKFIGRQILNIL